MPRVVAVTDSEFLGQDINVATVENRSRDKHVSHALKALGLTNAKGVATPGTDDVGGPKANEISELRRTAKWHDPPEEIKEEDDLLTGELKLFQVVAARFNVLAMDKPDPSYSVKELMHPKPHRPQESCSIHDRIPANHLQKKKGPNWTAN